MRVITIARKPLDKGCTVAENVLRWGVGGLNVDACRIAAGADYYLHAGSVKARPGKGLFGFRHCIPNPLRKGGRWPANLVLTGGVAPPPYGVPDLFFRCDQPTV